MHYGTEGMKKLIQGSVDNAKYLAEKVKKHPNFELLVDPEYAAVCFHYYPDRLKDVKVRDEKFWKEV